MGSHVNGLDEHGEDLKPWERRAMARIRRTAVRTAGDCIETGRKPGADGYVTVYATNYRSVLAHRLVYECTRGRIPAALHIDHRCRNRVCVNPEHLEPVTQAENNRRAAAVRSECPQGHLFDERNTYIGPKGDRRCRRCAADRAARARVAAKEASRG